MSQGCRVATRTPGSGHANGLIGTQPLRAMDPTPLAGTVAHVLIGARDEESQRLRDEIQSPIIDVAAVEEVESPDFQNQLIEQIHVVHLPAGHINGGRNAAAQVEQSVQLHRTPAPSKLRPREKGQAPIDGGGVEGVDRLVQFYSERLALVEGTRLGHEYPREIGIDTPIALSVSVGEIVARDAAPKAHVIKLAHESAGRFRCRADSRGRRVGQKPEKGIDPGKRNFAPYSRRRSDPRNGKIRRAEADPLIGQNRSATVHAPLPDSSRNGRRVFLNSHQFCSFCRSTRC